MKNLEQLKETLTALQSWVESTKRGIGWVDFALNNSPAEYTTPTIQSLRLTIKECLEAQLEETKKEIKKIEFQIFEVEVLNDRLETKRALRGIGIPHRSEKGIFYLTIN